MPINCCDPFAHTVESSGMASAMSMAPPSSSPRLLRGLRFLPPSAISLAYRLRRPFSPRSPLHLRLCSSIPSSAYASSSSSSTALDALQSSGRETLNFSAFEASEMEMEPIESADDCLGRAVARSSFPEHRALAALLLALGFALGSAEAAMALGPEGPLVEEFWDNMRRYGLYFLTVATGGMYSLLQPIFALLRNPLTAILTLVVISGSFYLLYLTLNTMLGVTAFNYKYG